MAETSKPAPPPPPANAPPPWPDAGRSASTASKRAAPEIWLGAPCVCITDASVGVALGASETTPGAPAAPAAPVCEAERAVYASSAPPAALLRAAGSPAGSSTACMMNGFLAMPALHDRRHMDACCIHCSETKRYTRRLTATRPYPKAWYMATGTGSKGTPGADAHQKSAVQSLHQLQAALRNGSGPHHCQQSLVRHALMEWAAMTRQHTAPYLQCHLRRARSRLQRPESAPATCAP